MTPFMRALHGVIDLQGTLKKTRMMGVGYRLGVLGEGDISIAALNN